MSRVVFALIVLLGFTAGAGAQGRGAKPPVKPTAKPTAKSAAQATKTEPANVSCPESLGKGIKTAATYCFVLAGTAAEQGVLVKLPARAGPATLIFDLHNHHMYSEQYVREKRAFSRYMAGIAILTMNMDVVGRAAVQSEFRAETDLYERIGGGAGPSGAKAVAPLGHERVYIPIPAGIDQVSLLGEVLDAQTPAGRETATPGRPVAVVSNIQIEYRPAPTKR
ncbi:hypothetical protein BH23ACI1_BH23ACI1_00760 [soil metagenome]|nr:hypothetical protein [Acidobacteriota bacterium]